jgi:hypothetical protein
MPQESPFSSYDIRRGQSRGASKSWWPFSMKPKQDESGEISNETVVGKFKGIVTVQSEEDLKNYKEVKNELSKELFRAVSNAAIKITGKPLIMDLSKLETAEGRMKFESQLDDISLGHLQICRHISEL